MSLWLAERPLVLASKSEVRRAILSATGIPLEIVPPDVDERATERCAGTTDPAAIAAVLAREKARAVSRQRPGRLVLGADQTLALGPLLFTKPSDISAAREQLKVLRGRTHELHAAIALVRDAETLFEHVATARLTMRVFSDAFLDAYVAETGSAITASVGCYQIEKSGILLFDRIEGDQFTIMGLPLLPLLDVLRRGGWIAG
jgi:nucleoside triphosphate pyrophosphatase